MSMPGRILALDVGQVRTGVAVSDPLQIIASPHSVIQKPSMEAVLLELDHILQETQPVRIVVGLPLNREGQPGPQAQKVLEFVTKLREQTAIEIVTQDERFTTAAAQRMLIAADVRRKKRKQVVDKIAATHILQTYLERQASRNR